MWREDGEVRKVRKRKNGKKRGGQGGAVVGV